MSITYPVQPAPVTGDAALAHRILREPRTIARRVQDLSFRRYVADLLLKERLEAVGGAIVYESGEEVGTSENPRAVAPGADYPLVSLADGVANIAKTTKWGQDIPVTDESIARRKMSPVNRAFTRLVNQNVMHVDSVAMSVVTTAVTSTRAVSASWTGAADAEQILLDVLQANARAQQRELGIELDTVVLDPMTYASVKAKFIAAGYVPREAGNPLATGSQDFLNVEGLVWVPTPHGITGSVVIADTDLLGGMADEDLASPGYARATDNGAPGVEVKSIRDEERDAYKLRARRVTVPVVLEPLAAEVLTGANA